MKKKYIWSFKYKGINCEIVNWNFDMNDDYMKHKYPSNNWNGYVFINKRQLPRSFKKLLCEVGTYKLSTLRKHWQYSKLEDYFDMHGGITYYELIRDEFTSEPIGVKVGCDYLHSWDAEKEYNENDVKRDLENSVDTFIRHFPNYLVWRITDGKYVKPETLSSELLS